MLGTLRPQSCAPQCHLFPSYQRKKLLPLRDRHKKGENRKDVRERTSSTSSSSPLEHGGGTVPPFTRRYKDSVNVIHHRSAHDWPFHEYLVFAVAVPGTTQGVWIRLERDADVDRDTNRLALLATILFDAPAADKATFANTYNKLLGDGNASLTRAGSHEVSTLRFAGEKPGLESLLRLARVISLSVPHYRLNTFNCWFFSRTILDILQKEYNGHREAHLDASGEETYRALRMAGPIARVEQFIRLRYLSISSHELDSITTLCYLSEDDLEAIRLPGSWVAESIQSQNFALEQDFKWSLPNRPEEGKKRPSLLHPNQSGGDIDRERDHALPENYSRMIVWAADVIKVNPLSTHAYIQLGYAYFAVGALRLAELAFKAGLDIDPSNASLHEALLAVFSRLQDLAARSAEALTQPARFIMAEEHRMVGHTHMSTDNYTAAIESYTASISLFPSLPAYYLNRAAAYKCLGEQEKACGDAELARRLRQNGR